MQSITLVLLLASCSYYTVAPEDAHRYAFLSREQRATAAVPALRQSDGAAVVIHPGRLAPDREWRDGLPMIVHGHVHPLTKTAIGVAVAGVAFLVGGAFVLAPRSSSCSECYGQDIVVGATGGGLMGAAGGHFITAAVLAVIGARRATGD
jgi:hypothetical protein